MGWAALGWGRVEAQKCALNLGPSLPHELWKRLQPIEAAAPWAITVATAVPDPTARI